jgi:molybdate transport system substrate-binding protein
MRLNSKSANLAVEPWPHQRLACPRECGTHAPPDSMAANVSSTRSVLTAAIVFALLACAALGGASPTVPPSRTEITVSAAISLKDALDEIARLYESENPGVVIHLNLGASGTLQQQIEQGAPVDVFISASPAQMDGLASQKLIFADTRKDLVRNKVALIVPKDRPGVMNFQDLAQPSVKVIATGDPQSVPAGKYAQEVLTHFGLFDELKPKFVFAKDVRQVLTYVETGNADAGIVYATDARTSTRVSVVATAPEDSHAPVVYPVAVIAGSKNPQAARKLVDFLVGPKSADVFQKFGFSPASR